MAMAKKHKHGNVKHKSNIIGLPKSGNSGNSGKGKQFTPTRFGWCEHWRNPIKIGGYTVLASASRDVPKKGITSGEPLPDLGIYLYSGWGDKLSGFVTCGIPSPVTSAWPFLVADWPDMNVMVKEEMDILVGFAVAQIQKGKLVEIGCMGAHGRTGTLLAMLKVKLEGLGPKEAIEAIRKEHCKEAVEARKQIDEVYRIAGVEPPKKAEVNPAKGEWWSGGGYYGGGGLGYGYATGGVDLYQKHRVCENCDHYEASHVRAQELLDDLIMLDDAAERYASEKEHACAFSKFDIDKPWECNCTEYKPKLGSEEFLTNTVMSKLDGESESPTLPLDALWEEGETGGDALGEMTPNMIEHYGTDICFCFHMRKEHNEKDARCNLCVCSHFEWSGSEAVM